MKTHDKLRDITHQIVKPVVNSCQNVNGFIVVSEKDSKEDGYEIQHSNKFTRSDRQTDLARLQDHINLN